MTVAPPLMPPPAAEPATNRFQELYGEPAPIVPAVDGTQAPPVYRRRGIRRQAYPPPKPQQQQPEKQQQ